MVRFGAVAWPMSNWHWLWEQEGYRVCPHLIQSPSHFSFSKVSTFIDTAKSAKVIRSIITSHDTLDELNIGQFWVTWNIYSNILRPCPLALVTISLCRRNASIAFTSSVHCVAFELNQNKCIHCIGNCIYRRGLRGIWIKSARIACHSAARRLCAPQMRREAFLSIFFHFQVFAAMK